MKTQRDSAEAANGACASPDAVKQAVVGVFDRAARTYDQVVTFFKPLGEAVVKAGQVSAGDDVVDLACGRGAVLFPATAAAGSTGTVAGFDLAPTMVELTRGEVERRGLTNVSVELGDAQDPPLPPASADVVLCGMGLFLVPDAPATLAAWARLLRPGGRVAVSVFGHMDPLWDRDDFPLRRFSGARPAAQPPGRNVLVAGVLEEELASAGFGGITEQVVQCDVVFRDVEQWWEWGWGNGIRRQLENVPPGARANTLDDLRRWLEPVTDAAGLHWRPAVRVLAAHL